MIFQAVVSNKAHPEYGQVTIPFPIPADQYDHTIELLEGLDIGSPTDQDCRVDFLDSKYPILNRLVAQNVNVDDLDYLAKRLESFCSDENAQFQAMAFKFCLSDIKDFINLTFCCQQATVITDFSDLDRVGKAHSLTISGGSMPMEEFDQVDGQAVALDLIQNGSGMVTPYGVVYDNGMELAQIYDGRHLPEYYYGPCVATVTLKPGLRLLKIDQQTGDPLSDVQFRIREVNGSYNELHFTDKDGLIVLEGMNPGAYTVQETKPKNGWVADGTVHTIYLEANKTTTIELNNLRKPDLYVKKVDSITGSPIEGVKFQIWRGSDDTKTGEYNDLGVFYTDNQGQIHLERQETGWYKIKELEPAPDYTIKQPDTQEIYMAAGKDYTVTFENTPKNAIIIEKYDSVTHEALPGCTFQLRYLAGSSGTGGTVIGQKVTGNNGIAMWTGLEPGAYVVEEVNPADGYSIINSSETVYLADNGEQSVITVRFNNSPDGSLLIRKVCATNPSVTLQNAEFKVTYSDGSFIGDGNGIYRSDENGEIRIDGLKPGKSVIVTEVKAPAGFIIDTQSQTVQIKEGRTVSLTFKNQPKGKLIIQKRDSQTNEVLPGAEFRVTTAAGCEVGLDGVIGTSTLTSNGIFTTDSQGEIRISNLAPGAYVISEIKAPDGGYVIDTPSTNVVIGQGGDTQTLVIKNTKKGGLVVEKYDSVTKQPLAGARFKIMMANGELTPDNEGLTSSNGLYTTDQNGQIILSKLLPGTYVVTEDKAPDNYRADPTPQTVVVNAGDTQTLRFYDDPLCTLTILKRDAVTKKPLKGAEFIVRDSSGRVIGPNTLPPCAWKPAAFIISAPPGK